MTGILTSFGTKLAEKWAALVVLPGVIFVVACVVAKVLGHRHGLDLGRLAAQVDRVAARPVSSSAGAILLVAVGAVAAAAVAGLAAGALAGAWEWFWHLPGHRWPAGGLTRLRRARWLRADETVGRLVARDAAARAAEGVGRLSAAAVRALERRDAIAVRAPAGPTWTGDRFGAVAERVRQAYAVDLYVIWPRLWLILPDQPRAELTAARDAHGAAARAGAWSVLYLALAVLWWPAVVAAVVLALTARYRARRSVVMLADLVEAAVDCHLRSLAVQVGLAADGPFTAGPALTELLSVGRGDAGRDDAGRGEAGRGDVR